MSLFSKLISKSGGYSLPFLIDLYDKNKNIEMHFINADSGIIYGGKEYAPGSFKYTPGTSTYGFDGGGKLEIAVKNNSVIDLVEEYNNICLDVLGVMDENGNIQELKTYSHNYGKVNGTRSKVIFNFDSDDRLNMTFPTLIWNNQNNRGNS